jgi:SAM-dependent methyltransferase
VLPRLPRALWWDHNAYYHRWLLGKLPGRLDSALDVGCGAGGLAARLADRAGRVDAVDRSDAMIERAGTLAPGRVNWLLGDLLNDTLPLDPHGYDLVAAVSSLHHLPLRPALHRLAGLVRPGGLLAVIGMYRPVTAADRALDVLALPATAAMGAVLAAVGRAGKPYDVGMPVHDPSDTLAEIRAAAAECVPGAVLRRRLFWRYTLLWRRPAA